MTITDTTDELTALLRDFPAVQELPSDDPVRTGWLRRKQRLVARLEADRRIFPQPISDHYDESRVALADESLTQSWGHCAPFCADDREPDGITVSEHGPYCASTVIGMGEAKSDDGARADLFVEVRGAYRHGTYRREDLYGRAPETLVAVARGDEESAAYLSLGEARRLAAALLRAADVGDGLDRDFNGSTQRRRTEP